MLEELATNLTSQVEDDRKEAQGIESKLQKLEAELANFYQAIADGIPADQLKTPIDQRLSQITDLTTKLEALQNNPRNPDSLAITEAAVESYVGWAWEHLQEGEVGDRKSFVRECIDKVAVDGDEVTIHYSFAPQEGAGKEVGFSWLPG